MRPDLLLVLDADHVPMPGILERTVPCVADPGSRSSGARRRVHNEQSLFYDVICRGKDRGDAAFWCGSSAVV